MTETKGTILLVDDDTVFRQTMKRALERRQYVVFDVENGLQALEFNEMAECDAALIDLKMPGIDGLDLLKKLRERHITIPTIMLTGHGSIETAIEAIKFGAFHYLTKPCDITELEVYLNKAIEQNRIQLENQRLRSVMERAQDAHGIVGKSPAIQHVLTLIDRMKDADSPVLITGPSGTGKELVAQALHHQSKRGSHPFIAINCATLKPDLLENELFGHVSGAFTGAVSKKEGLLSVADQGSLFIDEIADMNPNVQASLLRVIETGEFRPLGSTKVVHTNVRIIAAANRDLEEEVRQNRFRQDLYYRLSVLVIQTPPLSRHLDDIPLLVDAYLQRSNAFQRGIAFSKEAIETLQSYAWPGNVRELFNICERAILLSNENTISADTIDSLISSGIPHPSSPQPHSTPSVNESEIRSLEDIEKEYIQKTLQKVHYNISTASDLLKIDRRTLQRKMIKYGLRNM